MSENINSSLQSFDVPVNTLPVNTDFILAAMGYDVKTRMNVPGLLCDDIEKLLKNMENHVEIKVGFRLFPKSEVQINKTQILIKDIHLQSGRIINGQLKRAESLLLFVCTLGEKYDAWMNTIKSCEDMFTVYTADTIGSELVELAVDWMEKIIASQLGKNGYKHSNRFSPGYCGWPLMDQHKIFSFLPENYCGIHLNESALMSPIKSVSGIYGLGKSITKKEYQCSLCSKTDCFKRQPRVT